MSVLRIARWIALATVVIPRLPAWWPCSSLSALRSSMSTSRIAYPPRASRARSPCSRASSRLEGAQVQHSRQAVALRHLLDAPARGHDRARERLRQVGDQRPGAELRRTAASRSSPAGGSGPSPADQRQEASVTAANTTSAPLPAERHRDHHDRQQVEVGHRARRSRPSRRHHGDEGAPLRRRRARCARRSPAPGIRASGRRRRTACRPRAPHRRARDDSGGAPSASV